MLMGLWKPQQHFVGLGVLGRAAPLPLSHPRSVGQSQGGFPGWIWGCWISWGTGYLFLALAVECKGKSNAVSGVAVKNTK